MIESPDIDIDARTVWASRRKPAINIILSLLLILGCTLRPSAVPAAPLPPVSEDIVTTTTCQTSPWSEGSFSPDMAAMSYSQPESALPSETVDCAGLRRDTYYFVGLQIALIGTLYVLPDSITTWGSEDKDSYSFARWRENVKNPGWDNNKWYVNYLAHPYWGAAYYIRGRERGLSREGAFWFSAFLSALFEFGGEALIEKPSYQDLIVTPVGGAILGNYFEDVRARIERRSDTPRRFDKTVLVLTDPLGSINHQVDKWLGIESELRLKTTPPALNWHRSPTESLLWTDPVRAPYTANEWYYGFEFRVRW